MRQSRVLTFVLLALMVWLLVTVFRIGADVLSRWDPSAAGQYIGSNPIGGAMGILVMLGVLGLLLVLFSEVGHSEPGPSTWPPEK